MMLSEVDAGSPAAQPLSQVARLPHAWSANTNVRKIGMTDEPWRKAVDDLDVEVLAAQDIASSAPWPSIALACALFDAGLIRKDRLLNIVDSLLSVLTSLTADRIGDPDDLTYSLSVFRNFLEEADLRPGEVAERVRSWDEAEMRAQLARISQRRSPRG